MGEVAGHCDELARGNQFIGIGNRTSIDTDQGPGLKGIRLLVHVDLRIDALYLLHKRILQQTVIKAVCLFLTVDGIH